MKSFKVIDSMKHEIIEVLMRTPHNTLKTYTELRNSLRADITDENFKHAITNLALSGEIQEFISGYKVRL